MGVEVHVCLLFLGPCSNFRFRFECRTSHTQMTGYTPENLAISLSTGFDQHFSLWTERDHCFALNESVSRRKKFVMFVLFYTYIVELEFGFDSDTSSVMARKLVKDSSTSTPIILLR